MTDRPQPGMDVRAGNAMMVARIAQMPVQPYQEGAYVLRVAEMRGRRSGQMIAVPIAVVQVGGARYLVSPDRNRAWARNLLAAGECTMTAGLEREHYRATLAPADEAVPVLRTYVAQMARAAAQFAVAQFPFAPNASDEQIRMVVDETAVFRLESDRASAMDA